MAVDLIYKHQQKTYELMGKSLEERGRAAYVYPTGCGKSFPALKYIEDNLEKTATIVVPSNFIKKQYEKNIKKYVENGDKRLKNGSIKLVTYQERHFSLKKHEKRVKKIKEHFRNLIRNGKNVLDIKKSLSLAKIIIPKIESDIVVFDEIHRMGAPEWERVVDQIMNEDPKRKVIGMSATPERTNKRNMAYEKFGDDVVYEMSLTEALSGEKEGEVLLKSPSYVRVVSLLKYELPKYKEQIELIEDEEKREKYLRVYQKLDTIVSNSPDIQDVIAAGMKRKNGKYIVFCKDREDMFDKIEHVKEIFGKVNSKINVDYVITKKSGEDTKGKSKTENDRTLEEFETRENGEGLNLLFCVDMLNEGVHLDGIDGEVLFDLTNSPILYKQRIGRALSSDKEAGETVIIDAANNWLAQIETYREIENAIQSGQQREKENAEKDWNLLKLLPEERELLEILKEIGEELRYNKGTYLSRALQIKEWCERNYGDKPKEEKYLPSDSKDADKEERFLAESIRSIRRWVLRQYEGKKIDEIEDEEHRKIVQIMRELNNDYCMPESLRNAIRLQKWCEEKYGDKPREEKYLPGIGENVDEEEKKKYKTLSHLRNNILKKYDGMSLDEIENEDHREIVKIIRFLVKEYGISEDLRNAIRVQKWCQKKYRDKPREEWDLPRLGEKADEEEKIFSYKLLAVRAHIVNKYEGIKLEDIEDDEHREAVKIVRFLDENYDLSTNLRYALQVKSWCEKKYIDKPIEERCLPSVGKKADEEEKKMKKCLDHLRSNLKIYSSKSFEEIENEGDREALEILAYLDLEYGLSMNLKKALKIKRWCEQKYGNKPREERRLPLDSKNVDSEEFEVALDLRWLRNRVIKKYRGICIEEIENIEDRKIIKIMGFLEENYMSETQKNRRDRLLKGKMQKAVGKQVAHNEETRMELEEPDKSLETEEEDVEK